MNDRTIFERPMTIWLPSKRRPYILSGVQECLGGEIVGYKFAGDYDKYDKTKLLYLAHKLGDKVEGIIVVYYFRTVNGLTSLTFRAIPEGRYQLFWDFPTKLLDKLTPTDDPAVAQWRADVAKSNVLRAEAHRTYLRLEAEFRAAKANQAR